MSKYDSSKFNVDKYSKDDNGGHLRAAIAPYSDAADALANNQQMVISFKHESSGTSVFFKAFITALNETYNCDWASESVFGRVDPIKVFRSTERKITLTFKVPAASSSEAYENLARLQALTQFLYPTYIGMGGQAAQMMGQAPLVRLKVMNLVQKNVPNEQTSGTAKKNEFTSYKTDSSSGGLLGAINNIQINHNLENAEAAVIQKDKNTILPTYIDVSVDFSPIHEHAVGWSEKGEALTANFPYGVNSGLTKQAEEINQAAETAVKGAGSLLDPDTGNLVPDKPAPGAGREATQITGDYKPPSADSETAAAREGALSGARGGKAFSALRGKRNRKGLAPIGGTNTDGVKRLHYGGGNTQRVSDQEYDDFINQRETER